MRRDQDERPDDPQALAGEYVLGLLDEAEARALEARMVKDATLREAVAAWRERLLPLDESAAPQAP